MDSLTFKPGDALLASESTVTPWAVLFEDEGPAGYFYACDSTANAPDEGFLDAMLIYNGASLDDRERERLASIQWSRNGLTAVLYLDGTAQALIDFTSRESFCRANFPNFMEAQGDRWRKHSHAWNDAALAAFEAELYT